MKKRKEARVEKQKKSKRGIFPIRIFCSACHTLLYEYDKEGPGHLLKCYVDRITHDHTKGDLQCHKCGQMFARLSAIDHRPIHKIIQGKVYKQGSCGD